MTTPAATLRTPRRRRTALIFFLGALAVLAVGIVVAIIANAGGDDPPTRPGSPTVYTRIEGLTDCTLLQAEFDTAAANHDRDLARGRDDLARISTSYMDAADARMRQLDCPASS